MAGGGGSVGYGRGAKDAMRSALAQALDAEDARRFDADVNRHLQEILIAFNAIDRDEIRRRLDAIDEALGDDVEFDQFLMAGSVVKHTAVNGLSDVDALLAFDPGVIRGVTPQEVREQIRDILADRLGGRDVAEVRSGTMAVTIVYNDGQEIQLLPAVRRGEHVDIPDRTGDGWISTKPQEFRNRLSAANESMSMRLVPAIKLVKSIVDNLPPQQQLGGYHVEAIAVEAIQSYPSERPRTLKSIVTHLLDVASVRVLTPMRDVTGQERHIDTDFGVERSPKRRLVADALSRVARQLSTTRSLDDWRRIVGERP